MNMLRNTLLLASITIAGTAFAQAPVNQAALPVSTVQQALTAYDDTPVVLKGQITKALGHEKYQFKDTTGVITVDIDDDLWHGRPLSPTTQVTLIGEVDIDYRPFRRLEIDVDAVHF